MRLDVLTALLRGGLMMSASYGSALGGKPHRAYVFLALRQATFGKTIRDASCFESIDTMTEMGSACAPITLRALAASVNLPVETCRAVVELMVARGICTQTERGLMATPAAWTDPAVFAADNASLRSLSEFADAFERPNGPLADRINDCAALARRGFSIERARLLSPWIDFVLRQLETFIPIVGDGMNAILMASVASAVFRRSGLLTGGDFAEGVQNLRDDRGISSNDIAGISGLPRETVRRRLLQLEASGFLTRGSDGNWRLNAERALQLSISLPLLDDDSSAGARLMRELAEAAPPKPDAVVIFKPRAAAH